MSDVDEATAGAFPPSGEALGKSDGLALLAVEGEGVG